MSFWACSGFFLCVGGVFAWLLRRLAFGFGGLIWSRLPMGEICWWCGQRKSKFIGWLSTHGGGLVALWVEKKQACCLEV